MEIIQGLIQPPKAQSADETIPTLCDRVENATLIGDRRSAILGLKSFSREYRETVVALGLKPLLSTLKKDYIDEASVKAILETLLILFIRGDGTNDLTRSWISQQSRLQNGKYPSPLIMKQEMETVDQFSLWIADAITQSEDLVHLLIQLLDTENFHVRLYTIQILESLVATRPTKARKSITSLPTGISTLVCLLDDIHETVRDEMILLLMAMVNNSTYVQGLVAFENIFERLFSIINEEGGLRGSIVVNDCLSLIHNILKYNTSNQTLFLETGNLPKLALVLDEPLQDESFFWNEQRIVNINAALDIVRLTVEWGNTTTEKHQNVLLDSNVLMIVLRLAFYPNIPKKVRPFALLTAADMIRGNHRSQKEFGKIDVPFFDPSVSSTPNKSSEGSLVPVVDLLVNWSLYANSVHNFPTRMAAVELLKSFLKGNNDLQLKFLSQQINVFKNANKENEGPTDDYALRSNLFEALLEYDPDLKLNPYKLYFTTDLLMYLFQSDNEGHESLREMTRQIDTGNGHDDEEAMNSVQTIAELLITSLTSEDIRIPISYITFLIFWLYGDLKATDDFLSSKPMIQSLLSFSYQVESEDDLTIKCLVTILLGVSYEFSTKSSPFCRGDYLDFITKSLGRDNYLSRVKQFKTDSLFSKAKKTGDILDPEFDETGLPQVYFSSSFVSFFLENYYRVKTALTHSPEEEPCTKISYESFEQIQNECVNLKNEINVIQEAGKSSLKVFREDMDALTEKHNSLLERYKIVERDYSAINIKFENSFTELSNAKASLEQLKAENHQLVTSGEQLSKDLEEKASKLQKNQDKIEMLEKELKNVKIAKEKAEDGINKMNRELLKFTREKEELQSQTKRIEKEKDKQIHDQQRKEKELETLISVKDASLKSLSSQLENEKLLAKETTEKLTKALNESKSKFQSHESLISKLTDKLRSLASSYKDLESERDRLEAEISSVHSKQDAELDQLKHTLAEMTAEKTELSSQNEKLAFELKDQQQTLQHNARDHQSELANCLNELEQAKQTKTGLQAEIDELKSKELEYQRNTEVLEKKCLEFSQNIEKYEKTIVGVESRCKNLEEELQHHQKKIATLSEEKYSLQKQIAHLKETEVASNEHLKTLSTEFQEKENQYLSQMKELQESISSLREEKAIHSSRISELQTELAEVVTAKRDIEKENSENIEKLKACEKLKEECCIAKNAEINKLKNNFEEVENKLTALDNTLKEQLSKSDLLKKDLSELQQTKNKVDKEKEKLLEEKDKLELLQDEKEQQIEQLHESTAVISRELEHVKRASDHNLESMQSRIDTLQGELKEKILEFEKERKLLNQGSSLVTQEYSDKVSKLEEKLAIAEQKINEKCKELDSSKETVSKLRSDTKKASDSNQTLIASLKSELKTQQEVASGTRKEFENYKIDKEGQVATLEKNTKALEAAVETGEGKTNSLEKKLYKVEQKLQSAEAEVESLKVQSQNTSKQYNDLEEEKTAAEKKIKLLANEKDELDSNRREDLANYLKNNDLLHEKLAKLEKEVENKDVISLEKEKIQILLGEKNQQFIVCKDALKEAKENASECQKEYRHLEKEYELLREKAHSEETELLELKNSIKEQNVALENSKSLNDSLTASYESIKAEMDILNRKNQELSSKLQHSPSDGSSEVDDLMLLVSDLDERNARYRKMLKEHGIEVTSDEEEDDDDDDDDDESE